MRSWLVALALMSLSTVALGEEAYVQRLNERSFNPYVSLKGYLGLWSALGATGLACGYGPIDHLELEAGVGLGLSGTQLSIMPKWTAGSGRNRYVGGLGISVGLPGEAGDTDYVIYWLNADLGGYEFRHPSGFTFAAAGGFTIAVAESHREEPGESIVGVPLPQFRIGAGWSFS